MVDTAEFLYSLLCLLACQLLRVVKKYVSMALRSKPPSRKRLADQPVVVVSKRIHPHPVASVAEEAIDSAVNNQREAKYGQPEKENKKADIEGQQKLEPDFLSTETAATVVVEEEGENRAVLHTRSTRRRPATLQIPSKPSPVDHAAFLGGRERERDAAAAFGKQVEFEGGEYYCVASKKGQRHLVMEDGYGVISNIHGDPKQAFFGVFDGHGGRAAVDFVSDKLGKNIVTALDELQQNGDHAEAAIKAGYLTTDREFLTQGVSSGACAATVLVKDGELHVANVGDCRVVISEKGVASALTDDHRAEREDERDRIDNYGGLVTCKNGMWRVQDTLAVTRSIGDSSLKEWVISEPATRKVQLSPDCEFLILASDGLWDKVTNQEAVDVVSRHAGDSIDQSCKDLIEISCSRGNRDDITVMVIRLDKFFSA